MINQVSVTPKVLLISFILCLTQNTVFSRQGTPPDMAYLDSLVAVGQYKSALEGYQQNITQLENKGKTISSEYVRSMSQAIYCQARLPDFAKTKDLVEKIMPRIDQYRDVTPLSLASLYLVIGEYDYLISGDFDRALSYIRRGYNLFKKADSKSNEVARAATYLGALFTNRTEYDSSLHYLRKARGLYTDRYGENHFLVAGIYAQMAYNLAENAQYWQGLSALKKMLTISTWEIDSTLIDEKKYMAEDSIDLFFSDFLKLSHEKKIPHQLHPIDAEVGRIIANCFFRLGDLNMAHEIAILFKEVYEQNESPYLVADCLNMLGNIYVSRYQFGYALSIYQQVKDTYIRLGLENAHTSVWVYENLAQTHNKLDNIDSTRYYHRKALNIKRRLFKTDNSQIARSYFNLASVFDIPAQSDSLLYYLNKAISAGYVDEPFAWYEKGQTFLLSDDLDSARESFSIALRQLKNSKSDFHIATLNGLGNTFSELGQLDSAYTYYQKALRMGYPDIEEVLNGSKELEIDKINHISRFLASLSRSIAYELDKYELEKDVDMLKRAKNIGLISERLISQVRGSFIMESDHLRFSANISSVIENTIEVNIKLYEQSGNNDFLKEAFRIADLNKSQILLEALRSTIKELKNDNNLVNQWSQLRNSLRAQRVKLQEKSISGTSHAGEIAQDKRKIEQLEDEYASLLKLIKETQPGLFYYVSDNSSDFSTDSFQKYLGRTNSIAVQYFQSENHLYQFWLSSDDIAYTKTKLTNEQLTQAVAGFHDFVSKPSASSEEGFTDYLRDAHALYKRLLPQLNEKAIGKNLIIIPDGSLSSIPFGALLSSEVDTRERNFSKLPYLIKQNPVSYAFSASVLSETLRNDNDKQGVSATGWAPFSDELDLNQLQQSTLRDKGLSKLVGASLEIQGIEKQFDGENFIGSRASENAFRNRIESSRIVHIATHGIVNEESPELSYLVFNTDSEDSIHDGILHLFELYDMSVKADLTILSACNTGNGKLAAGEGVMSMARAFTYSGSKSVMMSLWLANDKSTYQIIDALYLGLADSETKSSALQKSKLAYLAEADNLMSHPFYWAHIITTGNDAPLVKSAINPAWLILLIVPLIVMVTRARKKAKA